MVQGFIHGRMFINGRDYIFHFRLRSRQTPIPFRLILPLC